MAREIGPEDVLRHMEVEPGLYVLGSFERRVTLYSQQVRALNLVYALHHEGRLKPGDSVAVIGGSAAGMTAAAGAARLGYDVTLLEKGGVLLPFLRGNHIRWVYPHLYDWPEPGSERLDAGLPLLDWRAALACDVADQLEAKWKALSELARIKVHPGVRSIGLHPGAPRVVTWNKGGPRRGKFAAVILAVGFGLERKVENTPWVSYWRDDSLHQVSLEGRTHHLISGCGDGGLIDLLRVCVRDFRHEKLIDRFLARVPAPTRERLRAIDEEARHARDPGDYLDEQYRALDVPQEVDDALGPLRDDTAAVLNGRDASALTLGASILNRFLVSRLLFFQFGVDYREGEFKSRRVKGRYEITFPTGDPEMFDHVTCRHGTGPAALESFRDVWSKCGPLRERSALDQARWPIYGDAFGPVPSGGAPPPAPAGKPPAARVTGTGEAPFLGVRSDSLGEGLKGRDQDLALLYNALLDTGSVALRSHPGHVYAHGGGGIGKSRLAIEYAWRRREDYPGGVFFAVVTTRTPLAVLASFGRLLFPGEDLTRDDDAAHRFAAWLADPSPGRRLLVLDDVQGSQEEVTTRFKERVEVRGQAIWPLGGLGHVTVLMTTRLRELPGAQAFEIRQLDAKGALALLLDKAGKTKLSRAEKVAAKDLADKVLGGHPLALSLAGAYVRRARLSFAEYRELLDAKGVLLKLEEAARYVGYMIGDHEASIVATYALSREQLAPTDPVDALGLRILTIAACLAPSVPIDRGLLRRILGVEGAAAELEEIGLAESRLLDLALLDVDREGWGDGEVAIHRDLEGITAIGVDEVAYRKGHTYLTLVYQIDAGCRRLLWLTETRTTKAFNGFFTWLTEPRSTALRVVCSDMWKPYLNVIQRHAGQALHVLDKFHIVAHLNKAVDETRRLDAAELRRQGDKVTLKHTRWCLLKRPGNLTKKQTGRLRGLLRLNLRTARAYILKEDFNHFWTYVSPIWAGKFLDRWCDMAMRSGIAPMKAKAQMLQSHRDLILNYFRAKKAYSSGVVEGLNTKVKLVTRKAFGYRVFDTIRIALFHALGRLPEPEHAHRFA